MELKSARRRKAKSVLLFAAAVLLLSGWAYGGDLEPSSPPGETVSFTLEDIYNRLNAGIAGHRIAAGEPVAPPGGTLRTIDEIAEIAPATDNPEGATPSDVASGKTFWGLTSGGWGLRTGTAPETGACMKALTPKTGYDICYDTDGNEIDCAGTGQDGDLQKGFPWPVPRFTDNGDGTVTDNLTTLVWLKNANCRGSMMSWSEALEFADSLHDGWTGDGSGGDCGLSDGSNPGDWRIPNINELHSLFDYRYYSPPLSNTNGDGKWSPGDPFNNVATFVYGSNSITAGRLCRVDFGWGYIDRGWSNCYYWPVRGGR